jgi:4-hydroxy-tetrahydrodipicolinate synthase
MKELRGTFSVAITPMKANGEVDEQGFRKNIDWQIEKGIAGLCVLGSTGEMASLTKEERLHLNKSLVEYIGGRVPVIVGTGAETTKETIEYTKWAKNCGADAALIINPWYAKPAPDEIFGYFKDVSEAVDIPIMVYNNPGTSGTDIKPELVAKLAELDNVKYVKDASGDLGRFREIKRLCGNKIVPFCGDENLAFEAYLAGAEGWICVIGNIIPDLSQQLFDLVQKMEITAARALFERMLPLLNLLELSGKLVQYTKAGVAKIGLAAGPVRLPRLPLNAEENKLLDEVLKDLGLL